MASTTWPPGFRTSTATASAATDPSRPTTPGPSTSSWERPRARSATPPPLLLLESDLGGANETGDHFGASLAVGDVDSDGCADLAIGVPGEDAGAGRVVVLFGSATGINSTRSRSVNQDTAGVPSTAEPGDAFGSALAFIGAGGAWVGSPREDVGSTSDAGAITQFPPFSDTVLRLSLVQYVQGHGGVPAGPKQVTVSARSSPGARTSWRSASRGRTSETWSTPARSSPWARRGPRSPSPHREFREAPRPVTPSARRRLSRRVVRRPAPRPWPWAPPTRTSDPSPAPER